VLRRDPVSSARVHKPLTPAISAAEKSSSVRGDEGRELHNTRRGARGGVRTDPHTVCIVGSCHRVCRQPGLWLEVLEQGRNGVQKQVLWQSDVEKAAQHLAPEVSNLVKLQPADVNNLQFVLC